MAGSSAEESEFIAAIGTQVDPAIVRPKCGPLHRELEPGEIIVVVPRQVVLDAVRDLRRRSQE